MRVEGVNGWENKAGYTAALVAGVGQGRWGVPYAQQYQSRTDGPKTRQNQTYRVA